MENHNPLLNLVPKPTAVELGEGVFTFKEVVNLTADLSDKGLAHLAVILHEEIKSVSEIQLAVKPASELPQADEIRLTLDPTLPELGEEGYQLSIETDRIEIQAAHRQGIFRGGQTLLRLMLTQVDKGCCSLPAGKIWDRPRFEYRSMMLDVARHFFPPTSIKRLIDLLAIFQFNHLHLHLTDDQGWRIEIKSWPNLTTIGGTTQVGGGKGGYYTQAEYGDLVEYARERYITVVPEIDLPGHTNAALASYPELNCDGKAPDLYTGTKVGFSSLCLEKPVTQRFLEEVIAEVASLTPGPFLHIGGDEAKSTKTEDYHRVVEELQRMVVSHGKRMIGWQEVSHCKLSAGSVVQYWTDKSELAELPDGVQLLMSPARHVYLDMKFNQDCRLGLTWAGYVNLEDSYNWDPETYLEDRSFDPDQILGVEAPLWSETIETGSDIEYMIFPRLLAVSEIGWSPKDGRNYNQFRQRIEVNGKLLDKLGVNYYRSELVDWSD